MTAFIPLTIIAGLNFLLAIVLLLNRPRREVNRVFAITALAVALWTLTNAWFQVTDSIRLATFIAQLSYMSGIVIAASFLHFAWIYPQPGRLFSHAKIILWLAAALTGLTPFVSDSVIRSVNLTDHRGIETTMGIYLIAIFMIVTTGCAFLALYRSYAVIHRLAREQLNYVLFGSIVTAICGLGFNLVFPLVGNYGFVWVGPASSLIFVGFTVYAIITRRLFDIRIVIRKTLVYSLLIAGIGAGFSLVEALITEALKHTALGDSSLPMANIAAAIFVSLFVSPSKERLEKLANKLVFRRKAVPLPHATSH